MRYTDSKNNITFNNVKPAGSLHASGPIGHNRMYTVQGDAITAITQGISLINGIDIDWNGALVEPGIVLNTTGDLLNWIRNRTGEESSPEFNFSIDNEGYLLYNGVRLGKVKGENGVSPTIGSNGNWFINNVDTGIKARGEDGITPNISIGSNGNWFINNVDTGVRAEGRDGTTLNIDYTTSITQNTTNSYLIGTLTVGSNIYKMYGVDTTGGGSGEGMTTQNVITLINENVIVTPTLSTGTQIATIKVGDITKTLYAPTNAGGTPLNQPLSSINSINSNPNDNKSLLVYNNNNWGYTKIDDAVKENVTVTPTLTNGTKIADITVGDNTKALYAPESESSPINKVFLPENIVNVGTEQEPKYRNILTQDMFNKDGDNNTRVPNTDTIFVVNHDFDINSDTITYPEVNINNSNNVTFIGPKRAVHLFEGNLEIAYPTNNISTIEFRQKNPDSVGFFTENNITTYYYISINGRKYHYTNVEVPVGKAIRLLNNTKNNSELKFLYETTGTYTESNVNSNSSNSNAENWKWAINSSTYIVNTTGNKITVKVGSYITDNEADDDNPTLLKNPKIYTNAYVVFDTTSISITDSTSAVIDGYRYYIKMITLGANKTLKLLDDSLAILTKSTDDNNNPTYKNDKLTTHVTTGSSSTTVYLASDTLGTHYYQICNNIGSTNSTNVPIAFYYEPVTLRGGETIKLLDGLDNSGMKILSNLLIYDPLREFTMSDDIITTSEDVDDNSETSDNDQDGDDEIEIPEEDNEILHTVTDSEVYVIGPTPGIYGDGYVDKDHLNVQFIGCYQKGFNYYYKPITVEPGTTLQLIDSRDCVLLNTTHNDWLYDDKYINNENDNITIYIASKTLGNKGSVVQITTNNPHKIIIPDNCVLEFNGGSINQGEIEGTNTLIIAYDKFIFNNITISGTWNIRNITSKWFKDAHIRDNVIANCFALSSNDLYNEITVELGNYWVRPYRLARALEYHNNPENRGGFVKEEAGFYDNNGNRMTTVQTDILGAVPYKVKSNTKLIVLGSIRMRPHYFNQARMFTGTYDGTSHDIIITGGGYIYGDKHDHVWKYYATGEKSHSIGFQTRNLTIDGINIRDSQGDGICLSHTEEGPGSGIENVIIRNFTIDNSYRNGITLGGCNILVENGYITNTRGTAPEDGIDLEITGSPTHVGLRNIIRNVKIDGAQRGIQVRKTVTGAKSVGEVVVENVNMTNVRQGFNKHLQTDQPMTIRDSYIHITPGYVCGDKSALYSHWGTRKWTYPKTYLNYCPSAINISNCVIDVVGDYPDGIDYSNTVLLSLRHTIGDRFKTVEGCKIDCPGITAFSSSYRNIYSNNLIRARKFNTSLATYSTKSTSDNGISYRSSISNCDATIEGIKYKGINYPASFFFDGALISGCEFMISCPIRLYNSTLNSCYIRMDLENYHYYFTTTEIENGYPYDPTQPDGGSPKYLISASYETVDIMNNKIHLINSPDGGMDYLVYGRNTNCTVARRIINITDNIFKSVSVGQNVNKDVAGMVFKRNTMNLKSLDDFITPYIYGHGNRAVRSFAFCFMLKHNSKNELVPLLRSETAEILYPIVLYTGSESSLQNEKFPLGTLAMKGTFNLRTCFNAPELSDLVPGQPVYLLIGRNSSSSDVPVTSLPSSGCPIFTQSIPEDITVDNTDIIERVLFVELGVAVSTKYVRMNLGYPPVYCVDNGVIKDYREVNPDWFKSAY